CPAASSGPRPLLLPVSPVGEQLLLLVAQRPGGLGILPVDSGLLVPAYLRDLLVQVFQVRLHTHPAFERRQAPLQLVEPRENVIGQGGRCPAARARTRTLHVLA